jgi:hypothetical protein
MDSTSSGNLLFKDASSEKLLLIQRIDRALKEIAKDHLEQVNGKESLDGFVHAIISVIFSWLKPLYDAKHITGLLASYLVVAARYDRKLIEEILDKIFSNLEKKESQTEMN